MNGYGIERKTFQGWEINGFKSWRIKSLYETLCEEEREKAIWKDREAIPMFFIIIKKTFSNEMLVVCMVYFLYVIHDSRKLVCYTALIDLKNDLLTKNNLYMNIYIHRRIISRLLGDFAPYTQPPQLNDKIFVAPASPVDHTRVQMVEESRECSKFLKKKDEKLSLHSNGKFVLSWRDIRWK